MKRLQALMLVVLSIAFTQTQALSKKLEQEFESLYEDRSCGELYYQVSELEYRALNYESALYNDRNNNIAAVVSTVFTPAVFLSVIPMPCVSSQNWTVTD